MVDELLSNGQLSIMESRTLTPTQIRYWYNRAVAREKRIERTRKRD